jgi:ribosomal protein S18 acetylase RimI-like enzyme
LTTFVPASTLAPAERAELFNAAYADYLVPFRVDEERLLFMERVFGNDLDASLVAIDDDDARIGFANLARDEADGWVGGVGVVPAHRGRGVGEELMRRLHDAARDLGLERVWLEVIVENEPARRLYEKLGYDHVRDLEVWTLRELVAQSNYLLPARASVAEANAWIREHRSCAREPWQRSDATVARLEELEPAPEGIAVYGGAAIVRAADGRVSVLQVAATGDKVYEELFGRAAHLGTPLTLLNLPAGDPAGAVLARLGGRVDVRQHEMVLELDA